MSVLIAADEVREPLYVIVPLQNPFRYKSRFKHTKRAIKHFMDSGAVVVLVEVAFNRREFVFADSGIDGMSANCAIQGPEFKHKYIPLRCNSEVWNKEAIINAGVRCLPHNWQQVAWLDSDIQFVRPNWVGQIIHQLQHYSFVQPFTHARDLTPGYELMPQDYPHADGVSFIKAWQEGWLPKQIRTDLAAVKADLEKLVKDFTKLEEDLYNYNYPPKVWPGLAMAATRQAWDAVGGLQDFHVWSGGDWVMGHALIGKRDGMLRNDLHSNYKMLANAWFDSCERHIRRNVGTVEGTVLHNWHGPKQLRGYNKKHRLLASVGFDPLRHLKRDYQGLWQLNDLGDDSYFQLRDMMREIAKERNEDSNQVPEIN